MTRQRLPNRRANESFTFEVNGLRYTATISRFADGRVGEIFLVNSKPSSQSDANARDSGIAASLAFQHGCSVEEMRRAVLRDARGNPATPLGAALYQISKYARET
jgi:ribonucleoside-diphosphate reductase alpha chain